MENILEQIFNNSKDNFSFLFKPFLKKTISYSDLNQFINDIQKLNINNKKIENTIIKILNNRYLKYEKESFEIEKIWAKYPHLQQIKTAKLLHKNTSIIKKLKEDFTKYYFENQTVLDPDKSQQLFKNLLNKNQKIFNNESKLILTDFFEKPTVLKKDFLFNNFYNMNYVMEFLYAMSQRNINFEKVFYTCMNYLCDDIINATKNNSTRKVVLAGFEQICVRFMVNQPYWNNPDSIFKKGVEKNKSQIFYGSGSGKGDDFNYLIYVPKRCTENIYDPFKDVLFLPCLKLSGIDEKNIINIIKIFASNKYVYQKDEQVIALYESIYNVKKLTPLQSLLHHELLISLRHYDLNQKMPPSIKSNNGVKIKI